MFTAIQLVGMMFVGVIVGFVIHLFLSERIRKTYYKKFAGRPTKLFNFLKPGEIFELVCTFRANSRLYAMVVDPANKLFKIVELPLSLASSSFPAGKYKYGASKDLETGCVHEQITLSSEIFEETPVPGPVPV